MSTSRFLEAPQRRHRVAAIAPSMGCASAPVLHDGVVALAGGSSAPKETATPVLQLIDVRRGIECGRVVQPDTSREVQAGPPSFAADGSVLFALYVHDTSLELLRVARDGTVQSRDELADAAWPVIGGDAGSKIHLAPVVPVGEADVLCSVLYRQGIRQVLARRTLGAPGERWSVDDWLMASASGIALGASPPRRRPEPKVQHLPPGETWHAREIATGVLRWSLDGTDRTLLGSTADRFVYADRQARVEEVRTRIGRADRAFLAEQIDEDALVAAWDASATAPLEIVTGCFDDGLVTGRVAVRDAIVGAHVDARGSCVVTRANDGATRLYVQNADGVGVADHLLDVPAAAGAEGPAVVGRSGDVLFVAWVRDLDAVDVHTGRTLWRLAIPEAGHGFAPRMLDRDIGRRDIAVNDEFLVIRSVDTLEVFA